MVISIINNSYRVFLAVLSIGKGRGTSTITVTVAVAFTIPLTVPINTIAVVPIAVAVTVTVIASSIRGRSPSAPVRGPGAAPPAVAVPVAIPVSVTVAVIVPVAVVPSTWATRTLATAGGASFIAPDGGRRILGPLWSRVSIALKHTILKSNTPECSGGSLQSIVHA